VDAKIIVPILRQMKLEAKNCGVVAWDCQIAIVERARVDIVSVGDSVDINW
jgi:hypothetical protein